MLKKADKACTWLLGIIAGLFIGRIIFVVINYNVYRDLFELTEYMLYNPLINTVLIYCSAAVVIGVAKIIIGIVIKKKAADVPSEDNGDNPAE